MSLKPIVKWAGGKRQLLSELKKYLPDKFNTYFEPFVGGGALFLDLLPEKACINDFNGELISVYKCLADEESFKLMYELCKTHEANHSEKYFYKIRDMDKSPSFCSQPIHIKAARCIYLNKACFNGLYRVNSNGFFNVPFNGKKAVNCFDEDNINGLHEYFIQNKPLILNGDFEDAVKTCKKGDFVYFDPPYDNLNDSSFTSYTNERFGKEEQIKLRDLVRSLSNKGVYVLVSNSKTDFICSIYSDFNIHIVKATRRINSKADKRGFVDEVIISNF